MVSHFSSSLTGGAGIAAQRLHLALCRSGVKSHMYCGEGAPVDSTMTLMWKNRSFLLRNAVALANSWRNRCTIPGGLITSPKWVRSTPIAAIGELPSVVNLHWVARWLDLPSFFSSLPAGLPVVWSLHDLIPITGGCHYPGDCDGFTKGCGNCPQQVSPGACDATHKFFRIKEQWYSRLNLHFVGNSEWTSNQIERSGLAKFARSIRTIHLGLDTDQFSPIDKICARQALGIPKGRFVIGFACADLTEERKGARLLREALKTLSPKECFLVTFGAGSWPDDSDFETLHLGGLSSPRLQRLFYSALDVFTTPSRVETFGNTAMEAMACGTPVVAYATSGLLDVIEDGQTGVLEKEIGSISGLARGLVWMQNHTNIRQQMGLAGRKRAVSMFSDINMARRYANLYEELVNV